MSIQSKYANNCTIQVNKYELIKLVILTLCLNKLIKNIHKLLN